MINTRLICERHYELLLESLLGYRNKCTSIETTLKRVGGKKNTSNEIPYTIFYMCGIKFCGIHKICSYVLFKNIDLDSVKNIICNIQSFLLMINLSRIKVALQ